MRIGRPRYRRDPALRRRLALALAGAEERLLFTHGEAAAAFVREVAHAMPFETALGIYTRLLGVPPADSRAVAVRALARLAEMPDAAALAIPAAPQDDSALGRLARRLGGRRNRAVRARIQRAAEQAHRALREVYLAGAADVIAALQGAAGPAEAVQVYIDALAIPPGWAEIIFHSALGGEEPAAA
jgi:hypothetical protein